MISILFDRLLSRLKGKDLGELYRVILFWVFHCDNRVIGADRKTFEVFPNNLFARDKRNVYWIQERIENANRDTFRPIAINYGKDKNYVFRTVHILEDANPQTIQKLDGFYTKDDKFAYWMEKKIEGCNADSFEILREEKDLSRDKYKVFFKDKIIDGADPESFIFDDKIGEYYYEDKYAIYYKNVMIKRAERNSFKANNSYTVAGGLFELYNIQVDKSDPNDAVQPYDFAVDKNCVFFRGKLIGERNLTVDEILKREDSID